MKHMTLLELKKIVDEEVAKGNGDAIILVQAYEDGISDIVITGYEGCGSEFGDGPLVFSLESGQAQNNAITCGECKNFGTTNCSESYREPTANDDICESFVGNFCPDCGAKMIEVSENKPKFAHISLAVIDGCKNFEDSYGEICVRCNLCGRFNEDDVKENDNEVSN